MESHTPAFPDESQGLEKCPRCVHGRIGAARLTCTLCFGAGMVQPWVADQERTQQASWERYLSGRGGSGRRDPDGPEDADGPDDGPADLADCARCWPTRCPQCPWTPPVFDPGRGHGLAA